MEDTIAAIATAPGEGGIGIVRISGEQSLPILIKIFQPFSKFNSKTNVDRQFNNLIINRRLTYGCIYDQDGSLVDEVMAVYMKGPHTYTAEDVVEIDCHGGMISLKKILSLVLRSGARLAEKGEFTKRAFLNGRIDLAQAEAVIDVIRAKTDQGFDTAMNQMNGSLSNEIRDVRKELMDFLALVIVNLDYPEEDIETVTYPSLIETLKKVGMRLEQLLLSAESGRMIREGLSVTIAGKPNVGKSSLMNALLRESRAIVTEIPGTTRDTIEEGISLNGIAVYLTDTAGIRKTEDQVEQIGIQKSHEAVKRADLILFMLDGSRKLSDEDRKIAESLEGKKVIILVNKSDLGCCFLEEEIKKLVHGAEWISISLKERKGIDVLEKRIQEMVFGGDVRQENSVMVTNVRHRDLLAQASEALQDALQMAEDGEALDFIEVDVRRCWELLGEITGETVTDDIIDEVFSRFCLGK